MVFIRYLRLRGFKSISTKTIQVDFDKGFSAIVGANGSGKSNILEAFSFVMGNLSAKSLRGDNMRTMIFSGNPKAGIPAAKEAYVELVLDNADRGLPIDTDIVKISRSIDLEGKGKYKINGTTTTRTEVQDLLSMGGLHSSGYSMVLQGSVYEVVNMSKAERRKLIEDIAGIAAYDEKKENAQKELDQVEENLAQVRLLLNEVSSQLAMLEKERDAALQYQHLTKQLEHSTNAVKILDIESLGDDIEKARTTIADLQAKVDEIDATIATKEGEIEEATAQIKAVTDELANKQSKELLLLNQELDQLKQALSDLKSGIKYLAEQEKNASAEKARLETEIAALETEKESIETDIDALQRTSGYQETELETKKSELQAKTAELASQDQKYNDLLASKEASRQSLLEAKNALNELRSELKMVETYIAKDTASIDAIAKKATGSVKVRDDIVAKLDSLKAEIASAKAGKVDSPDKIQGDIKRCESDLRITKDMIRQKSEIIYEIRSTIKAAQNFNNNGATKAISALLEAKKKGTIKGIHDTISNLGKVDSKYAVAMDIAAAGKTNFMVVDNRNVATECINYLKKNNLGRLSFIPLDKISYKEYDHEYKLVDGVHGRAVDLIDFENSYLPAFEFIFGHTFIVDDLEIAKAFAPKYRRVTLDGDVIDPSNLMTGGSLNKKGAGSAFQNKDEERLPAMEQELEALKQKEKKLDREIRDCQARISDYYTTKINTEKHCSDIKEQIAKFETKLEEIDGGSDDSQQKIQELQATIDENATKKDNLCDEIQQGEEKVSTIQGEITAIDESLGASPHAQLQSEIKALEKAIKTIEANINKSAIDLAQKNTRLTEHVVGSIQAKLDRIVELDEAIATASQSLTEKEGEKSTTVESIDSLEQQLSEKNAELSSLLSQKREFEKNKDELANAVQRSRLERQAADLKHASQVTKAAELEQALQAAKAELPENLNVPEEFIQLGKAQLLHDIEGCKKEVEKLGNVNMMAIEKYNDNKARFDDLSGKHEILIKERESIIEFMDSVEKQKKTAFLQAYQSIARNFAYIFSRLSPGGEAKLELENFEDPFAGGVQIMARPAGKPLNEISLLSGGEKALTSLSLIFAIQQHCPSPLYILDEIDAALDDANAALVADLIKELSNRSQFIIVTHRDVTMTRVDQILGVSNVDGVTDVIQLHLGELSKVLVAQEA
ncbi:MAG TPA: chromosome segregation protein SMC [Candidatus Lokiarchaeia archaeon]|nr:chromosome segregation protein SMC [Candidatus Lokiarchaeia archaeon]